MSSDNQTTLTDDCTGVALSPLLNRQKKQVFGSNEQRRFMRFGAGS